MQYRRVFSASEDSRLKDSFHDSTTFTRVNSETRMHVQRLDFNFTTYLPKSVPRAILMKTISAQSNSHLAPYARV